MISKTDTTGQVPAIPTLDRMGGDAPIETSGEDLLGFEPFSRALAVGMVERAPDDGFVVGLQARWGMGKSSAVNLCLAHIRLLDDLRPEDTRITVQAFNPWFYSGVDALTTGYLSALSDAVEAALGPRKPGFVRKNWRKMKKGIGFSRDHSDAIGATAAGALTLLSAGKAAPLSGAVKGTIVSALQKKPSANDLSKRFKKLVGRLDGHLGRVLIVVDDLDRLQPVDVRQVLSLVKTFGNLRGVTHLLVYDRDILDAALVDGRMEKNDRRLPSYREKIVQAEFDLPAATVEGLRRLVARGVDPLFAAEPEFHQMDWFHASQLASHLYLRSPRDVVRFTNGLSVGWPTVAGEAYFPDFFIMELWRLFERDFYDGIRDHKEIMLGARALTMLDEDRKRVVTNVVNRIPENRRSQVVRVFSRLFPSAARHLDKGSHGERSHVKGRWRVGDATGFDAYFRMCPPEGEYTQADLVRIKAQIADEAALETAISDAVSRKAPGGGTFLPKLLDALIGATDGPFNSLTLLNVLGRRGDEILRRGRSDQGMAWSTGTREISQLVDNCLEQIAPGDRRDALREALSEAGSGTKALILSSQFEPYNANLSDDIKRQYGPSFLSEEEARTLAEAFVQEVAKDPSVVFTAPIGWQAIALWNSLYGPEPIEAWISQNLHRADVVIFFIDMVMSEITSSNGQYRELRGKVGWDFFDINLFLRAAKVQIGTGLIAEPERDLVEAFIRDASKRVGQESEAACE